MTQAIDYKHVSILWAGSENAAELAGLHGGLFDKPWDASAFHGFLAHPGCTAFVARLGSPVEMVGFIVGQLAADEAEILTLGVRADRQRHGIGRKLVEALARAVKKAEAKRLFLEVGNRQRSGAGPVQVVGLPGGGPARRLLSKACRPGRGCPHAGP